MVKQNFGHILFCTSIVGARKQISVRILFCTSIVGARKKTPGCVEILESCPCIGSYIEEFDMLLA